MRGKESIYIFLLFVLDKHLACVDVYVNRQFAILWQLCISVFLLEMAMVIVHFFLCGCCYGLHTAVVIGLL